MIPKHLKPSFPRWMHKARETSRYVLTKQEGAELFKQGWTYYPTRDAPITVTAAEIEFLLKPFKGDEHAAS